MLGTSDQCWAALESEKSLMCGAPVVNDLGLCQRHLDEMAADATMPGPQQESQGPG